MVSVIIVTYNVVNTLQACLDSIYVQSLSSIPIIIIDGGSTDGTVKIIEDNAARLNYFKSEKDNGIYDAMNKALVKVETPWVYFLGADDTLLPEFSTLLQELEAPDSIYYANVIYKGLKLSGEVSPYKQAKLGLFHQSIVYPASAFKKYRYNQQYPIAADYALNMQLFKDPNYKFVYKDYVICHYNDTGISAHQTDINFEKDKSRLVYQNFGPLVWIRYQFRALKAGLKPRK